MQQTDEVTGIVTHHVRGKDDYVLNPVELEKEKPLFMDVPSLKQGIGSLFTKITWPVQEGLPIQTI